MRRRERPPDPAARQRFARVWPTDAGGSDRGLGGGPPASVEADLGEWWPAGDAVIDEGVTRTADGSAWPGDGVAARALRAAEAGSPTQRAASRGRTEMPGGHRAAEQLPPLWTDPPARRFDESRPSIEVAEAVESRPDDGALSEGVLGDGPLGDRFGDDPLGDDPLGDDPLGDDRLGAGPLGGDRPAGVAADPAAALSWPRPTPRPSGRGVSEWPDRSVHPIGWGSEDGDDPAGDGRGWDEWPDRFAGRSLPDASVSAPSMPSPRRLDWPTPGTELSDPLGDALAGGDIRSYGERSYGGRVRSVRRRTVAGGDGMGAASADGSAARALAALNPGRRAVKALAVVAGLVVLVAAYVAWSGRPHTEVVPSATPSAAAPPRSTAPSSAGTPSSSAELVVAVEGRVRHPGLVHLPAGARVADALAAAGGVLPGTDLSFVNLARKVTDGELIVVGVTPPPGATLDPGASGGSPAPDAPVNLNTATEADLETLPGIGPALAQRIIDYRTQHGGFHSIDELRNVSGIGDAKYAEIADRVTV